MGDLPDNPRPGATSDTQALALVGPGPAWAPPESEAPLLKQVIPVRLTSIAENRLVYLTLAWHLEHSGEQQTRPVLRARMGGQDTVVGRLSGDAVLYLTERTGLLAGASILGPIWQVDRYQPESVTLAIDGVGVFHGSRAEMSSWLESESGRWRLEIDDPRLIDHLRNVAQCVGNELRRAE